MSASRSIRVPDALAAIVIALVAIAVRLAVAREVPLSAPVSDMLEYWERATYIAANGRLYENSWRMPGYPAALAAVFSLGSGPSLEAARAFNAFAGAAVALLTYGLARRTAGVRAAFVAALTIALYPSFIVYTTFIATEAVVGVPLVGALIAAAHWSKRAAAIGGVCAALTTLMRPAGIALLPAIVVAFARSAEDTGRSRWSARPLLVVVFFVLTMAPWWIHNVRLHGRFVPLDTTGGINLLIGSGPLANGHWDWASVARLHTDLLPGVETTTPAGSDRASAIALSHIRQHPLSVVRLAPAKLGALLAIEGREHAYLYSFGYFGARGARVVWLWGISILAAFPLLLVAAMGGCAVREGVRWRVLEPSLYFLLTSAAMHIISFGDPRFHLPMVPVFAVLATGIARWRQGVVVWRVALAVVVIGWLSLVWRGQLTTYFAALMKLVEPNGWNSQLSFDDLL